MNKATKDAAKGFFDYAMNHDDRVDFYRNPSSWRDGIGSLEEDWDEVSLDDMMDEIEPACARVHRRSLTHANQPLGAH